MGDSLRPEPRPVALASVCAAVPELRPASSAVADLRVSGATLDSRDVRPGDLYLALPGRVTHGALHAIEAVRQGAVAVVTDEEGGRLCAALEVPVLVVPEPRVIAGPVAAAVHGWPARDLQVVGITGTNGKTTITAMVESGFQAAGLRTGAIGTVGVHIAGRDLSGVRTTPEATDLQAILAVMRDERVQFAVMEVSSIALEEHRVDGFRYDVAAFTQLSQDHLDYHGDMETYYRAKARLFTPQHAAIGVVGVDDEYGRRLSREATIPVYTWSVHDPKADWRARDIRSVPGGSAMRVAGPQQEETIVHVPLPGDYNVANALCAFAVLRSCGVESAAAARGLGSVQVPGRMQTVGRRVDDAGGPDIIGIVDYAHTPDAIGRALDALRGSAPARIIAVLGAGGDRDAQKRPLMGAAAAQGAEVVIVTDDNPRSEDPAAIRASVMAGARAARGGDTGLHDIGNRAAAISVAVDVAEPGDIIVVLGKGHEQGQEVAGVVTPFDDAVVLADALDDARRIGTVE